jgi:hypothetical protein
MRALSLLLFVACGEPLYAPCDVADDCPPGDGGDAACLEKSGAGYCTWTCASDDDCAGAAADSVCASFESEDEMYCFPSCAADAAACPPGMTCRSTGGGVENRKVCFPEDAG